MRVRISKLKLQHGPWAVFYATLLLAGQERRQAGILADVIAGHERTSETLPGAARKTNSLIINLQSRAHGIGVFFFYVWLLPSTRPGIDDYLGPIYFSL